VVADPTPTGRRLVLVRHGQTAWNAAGRAQGHADISLDGTGRRQAERMAAVVARSEPDLLLTSDLARARETAAFLEKATGLTAEEDPRLREYDVGLRTGLTREEFAARLGEDPQRAWDPHAHVDAPGAETMAEVRERIVPAVREALQRLGPGETGVVVTHGAALRIALAGLLDWPLESADTLEAMANCGWAVVVEHGAGRLRLSSYNTTVGGPPPDWQSAPAAR
jgi:broad specificity phosphatase PhoE